MSLCRSTHTRQLPTINQLCFVCVFCFWLCVKSSPPYHYDTPPWMEVQVKDLQAHSSSWAIAAGNYLTQLEDYQRHVTKLIGPRTKVGVVIKLCRGGWNVLCLQDVDGLHSLNDSQHVRVCWQFPRSCLCVSTTHCPIVSWLLYLVRCLHIISSIHHRVLLL